MFPGGLIQTSRRTCGVAEVLGVENGRVEDRGRVDSEAALAHGSLERRLDGDPARRVNAVQNLDHTGLGDDLVGVGLIDRFVACNSGIIGGGNEALKGVVIVEGILESSDEIVEGLSAVEEVCSVDIGSSAVDVRQELVRFLITVHPFNSVSLQNGGKQRTEKSEPDAKIVP